MRLNSKNRDQARQLGMVLGLGFAYLVFTIILFLVLNFFNKTPDGVGYVDVALISLLVPTLGLSLREYLGG